MNLSENIIENIIQRPKVYLITFAVFILLSLAAMTTLTNDPNPEILPLSHKSRVNNEALKQQYSGTKDYVSILIEAGKNDSTILNTQSLTRIASIIQDIKNIDVLLESDYQILKDIEASLNNPKLNIYNKFLDSNSREERIEIIQDLRESLEESDSNALIEKLNQFEDHLIPIIKISSLFDTDNIVAKNNSLLLKKAISKIPTDKKLLAQMSDEIYGNKLFNSVLISDDLKNTGVFMEINLKVEDSEAAFIFYKKLKKIIADNPGNEQTYIAGTPIITANIANIIDTDMGKFVPIVLILIIAVLWIKFRMARGVYIPLIVVVGSILITLAVQSLFAIPINVISSALPVFLISIGIVDGVHIYADFRLHRIDGLSNNDAMRRTLNNLGLPVIATSVTTALAFWSLSFTEIIQIKHFGIFVGVGAMIAMILSLTIVPAIILLLSDKHTIEAKDNAVNTSLNNILTTLTKFTLTKPWFIVIFVAVVAIFSAIGMTNLLVDNNRVAFFKTDSEIFIGAKEHNNKLSGTEVIDVILNSDINSFKQPANIAFISKLEEKFRNHKIVGKITSVADLLERMNLVMNDNKPTNLDWNSTDNNLISQYFLMYENSGGDLLSDFVTTDYSQVNIRINVTSNSSKDIKKLVNELNLFLKNNLPTAVTSHISGNGVVLIAAGEEIIYGQLNSFIISIIVVLISLFLVFRSWIYAIVGSTPLIIASAINFGLMGALDIPLDIGSAIISSIAIGVGVDFSIHYLSKIRIELSKLNNFDDAALATISRSGNAIASNAFIVGAGFLALMFSNFVPIVNIGWIVSLTMFSSSVLTLFLTPAILKILNNRGYGNINPSAANKNNANNANDDNNKITNILLIGSGYISYFSYLELKKKLAYELQRKSVKISIISPENYHAFHGFIGEVIAGIVPIEHTLSPNRKIFAGANFIFGRVSNIDTKNQNVQITKNITQEKVTMNYDHLLIGAGALKDCDIVSGINEYGWTLRNGSSILGFRNHLIQSLEKTDNLTEPLAIKKALTFVVAGGGFTGVEMSAAIADFHNKMKAFYPVLKKNNANIILIHSGKQILPELQEKFAKLIKYARKQLNLANIELKLNTRVMKVDENGVLLSDGTFIKAQTVLSTLGSKSVQIKGTENFIKDKKDRLKVDNFLRVKGFTNIWSGGDIANVIHYYSKKPCPTNALWAIKEGKYLARNLAKTIHNKPLKPFNYWGLGQVASFGVGKGMSELYTIRVTGWLAYLSRLGFFVYFLPGKRQKFEILLDHIKLLFLDIFMVPLQEDKILGYEKIQKNTKNPKEK